MVLICHPLLEEGNVNDALRLMLETVSRRLDDAELSTLAAGLLLKYTALHEVIVTLLRNVVERTPDNVEAWSWLAGALVADEKIAEGLGIFSDLIQRYPQDRAMLYENISASLIDAGYLAEALQVLSVCLEQEKPTVTLMLNLGNTYFGLGMCEKAIAAYDKSLELMPYDNPARLSRSYALLKARRLDDGWEHYVLRSPHVMHMPDWILALPRLRRGNDVAGKRVLIYQEQGLGDTIQFIRSVSFLLEHGAKVTAAVPDNLVRLMDMSFPTVVSRTAEDIAPTERFDYGLPIPDLPYIAGIRSEADIPDQVPYLRVDPGDIAKFAAILPPARPRIGLVWAGDRRIRSHDVLIDRRRSTTLAEMASALTPVDATLVNLQFGPRRADLQEWHGQPLFDPMGSVRDIADTAALMESLDLIISVDTSPVHLAGALGRPVWLVNRRDSCWRWGEEGESTVWYPTMRIFRSWEKSFGPVLKEVGDALQQWVAAWKKD
ncbi:tetratricopeptide repeat-containing glycosyltransferase family protein [Acetobacter sp. TBRC 12305]|uniref:Glycosyltransferase family protein n=2 Tax=Acetobacter garciniae TaxID=2817435 RepID=A0A939HKX5_9PROT|nr:glycosyltransferase family protein [Acetobacter garciniae]MBX0344319.1 tetratricopeptide repeat-containing glycosyltransferase family protein [Acetobacter garciniae]